MSEVIIEVAKENKDLRDNIITDLALSSKYVLPKIVVQKQITTNDTTPAQTSHELLYAPKVLKFLRGYLNDGSYKIQPYNYNVGIGNGVDDNYLYGFFTEIYNPNTELYEQPILYSVIFSDSVISNDDSAPVVGNPKLIAYKEDQTKNPRHSINSLCDTLKADITGVLTLSVPSATLTNGEEDNYSTSFSHEKEYLPIVSPFDTYFDSYLLNEYYGGSLSTIPTNITLNNLSGDSVEKLYPSVSSYSVYETITYYFNDTKLQLDYTRLNISGVSQSCPARTIKLYYTVFENKLDDALNLLN